MSDSDYVQREEFEKFREQLEPLVDFIDSEGGVSGRTIYDDWQLLRQFINRFKSAKFFIGAFIGGVITLIPFLMGLRKLYMLIKQYLVAN